MNAQTGAEAGEKEDDHSSYGHDDYNHDAIKELVDAFDAALAQEAEAFDAFLSEQRQILEDEIADKKGAFAEAVSDEKDAYEAFAHDAEHELSTLKKEKLSGFDKVMRKKLAWADARISELKHEFLNEFWDTVDEIHSLTNGHEKTHFIWEA